MRITKTTRLIQNIKDEFNIQEPTLVINGLIPIGYIIPIGLGEFMEKKDFFKNAIDEYNKNYSLGTSILSEDEQGQDEEEPLRKKIKRENEEKWKKKQEEEKGEIQPEFD